MRADMVPVPGRPGEFFIPSAGVVNKANETFEDAVFDTIETATGLLTAGLEYRWFDTSTNKNLHHQNYGSQKKVPSHHELKLTRIGLYVRQIYAGTPSTGDDTAAIYENGAIKFLLGTRLVSKGPGFKYPSGYGLYGVSTENNFSAISCGIPSVAAAPLLAETQDINDKIDLDATLTFFGQTWQTTTTMPTLSARMNATFLLHGTIKKPLGV